MPRGNDLERDGLQLVLKAGENGILQSDMWKTLKVTSREGSRLAKKFVDKGAVERKKVLHEGRWTYKLYSLTKPVTIESILDCPCMVCEEIDKCFVGGQSSPLNCHPLNLWIRPDMAPIITESDSEP
ncbi:hypothetical protein MCGE09_00019 [Thaumarchaeota archaeon SCGC AB-539-E09]|nr:hypothetical protein MCGE09_00019 [Thaumarchaeota archaeon SCGC AB-539-E09]